MLIKAESIHKSFKVRDSFSFRKKQQVLNGVTFRLEKGECLGIVGESGSGKSTLGKILLGLEKPDKGKLSFAEELSNVPGYQSMSVVFQDYNTSVNPRLRIGEIISEAIRSSGLSVKKRISKVEKLLQEVGLSGEFINRYPHQLSGGQLQRVCIARAIAPTPQFVLLDEAVSSLDVSIQTQVLDLLISLKELYKLSYLFITHDITVATYICDRILFFQDGKVIEQVESMKQLGNVRNPYARNLLSSARFLEKTLV